VRLRGSIAATVLAGLILIGTFGLAGLAHAQESPISAPAEAGRGEVRTYSTPTSKPVPGIPDGLGNDGPGPTMVAAGVTLLAVMASGVVMMAWRRRPGGY
jgi:hypothetical protein